MEREHRWRRDGRGGDAVVGRGMVGGQRQGMVDVAGASREMLITDLTASTLLASMAPTTVLAD
jgi:hypothetical protein